MTAPAGTKPVLPRAIWALGFVSLLMDVSSELIHSLLPVFMVVSLGASAFTVGLIEGTAEATALIVKVFSGVLSDRWGKRKPLAVLGYGLGALSKPLFALAGGSGLVIFARLMDRVGKLSDRMSHRTLLGFGLVLLIAADAALASSHHWTWVWAGISLWGLHLAVTHGLLAAMVADTAPADLRGTAYGFFNLVSGIAMLIASALARLLWDRLGAEFTFIAGGAFSALALVAILASSAQLRR